MAELLVSCQELSKAFGAAPLFEGLSLGVFEGDHVGLVGPNGSGKTTLLKILAGLEEPSTGTRAARKRLRIGYVPQDPVFDPGATVFSVLREALRDHHLDEHEVDGKIAVAMGKAGFADGEQATGVLSGGWKKRLAIARALVGEPELLLLDEPTNHLDVDGILWLEELLPREPEAFVAVSHDRYFLEAVAGRVIELDRAFALGLFDVRGRYSRFLEKKDELLAGQAAYQESLRNRVRGELDWLSRKARARTRKAQARIDEAQRLQDELRGPRLALEDLGRRARLLGDGAQDEAARGGRGADQELRGPRDRPRPRPRPLAGHAPGPPRLERHRQEHAPSPPDPAGGTGRGHGRARPRPEGRDVRPAPLASRPRGLAASGRWPPTATRSSSRGAALHVAGWAKRFLFRSEQLETPVGRLSGGEQARAVLARLMLEPADLLLLDEPTNDLDIPTLEVLEESLLEFPGALVLVTHDRYLLDRVSTRILSLDGKGGAVPFADYDQWEQGRRLAEAERPAARPRPPAAKPTAEAPAGRPRKLGYREQREWDEMEARILAAEERLETCREAAADPSVAADHQALAARIEALSAAQAEVDGLYARWAELEGKARG